MKPNFSTVDFIWGSDLPTNRKRQPCCYSFTQLSRSSPARTEGMLGDALKYCKHGPPTAQIKDAVPFVRIIRVRPLVACYSTQPPSTPLYLMPISSTYNTVNKSNSLQKMPKIKVTSKNSRRIVKKVLLSILNSVEQTVATNEFARSNFETLVTKSYDQKQCDVAIQTEALNSSNRYYMSQNEDVCSSSNDSQDGHEASERSWAGEVRALRDSHVRLVLRQLRQLRDIDRLDRALRRPPPTPTLTPNPTPCTRDSLT